MNRDSAYQALLIDLDGVLRLWPADDARLEDSFGLPAGAILKAAFEPGLLREAITGRISDEAWRRRIEASLAAEHPTAEAVAAVQAWSAPCGEVNLPVLELLRQARESVKVVLVTNATSRLDRDLHHLGLSRELDIVINSSVVGTAKPGEEIFASALAAAGVAASRAVYVDDSLENVESATKLGVLSFHFQGITGLASFLQSAGVTQNPR